jgi:hypothetical protein
MNEFERQAFVEEPAIAGAQWWQKSLTESTFSRRNASLLVAGTMGALAIGANLLLDLSTSDSDAGDELPETRELASGLEMQRRFGWSFGAPKDDLPSPSAFVASAERTVAERAMLADPKLFSPQSTEYLPHHSSVLLEVGSALPKERANGDTTAHMPFPEAYRPLDTNVLPFPFQVGVALGPLAANYAIVVDLDGPESIALAAGLARTHVPILKLENWPHPQGVCKSHITLAALLFLHQCFNKQAEGRAHTAKPMFVLDRGRLDPLVNATLQFDNRYQVSMPTAEQLDKWGVTHVVYVAASAAPSADVYDAFVEYERKSIHVRLVKPVEFSSVAGRESTVTGDSKYAELERGAVAFGSGPEDFARSYEGAPGLPHGRAHEWRASDVTPQPRVAGLGLVPVVVVAGIIVGAEAARRRGSWARTLSGGGG